MELPTEPRDLFKYTHCEFGCLLKIFLSRDIDMLLYNPEKWKQYSAVFLELANNKRTQSLWKTAINKNYLAKFVPIFIKNINEKDIENKFNKYINQIYFEINNLENNQNLIENNCNNYIKSYIKAKLPKSSPNALPNSNNLIKINNLKQKLNNEKAINNQYIEYVKNNIPNRIEVINNSKILCLEFINKLKKCV